jgi:hypothetical protein
MMSQKTQVRNAQTISNVTRIERATNLVNVVEKVLTTRQVNKLRTKITFMTRVKALTARTDAKTTFNAMVLELVVCMVIANDLKILDKNTNI